MSKTKNNMKSSPQADQFDRCFLTGCDKVTEWQLPWFVENFKKWMPDEKLSLANFGVSDECMKWAKDSGWFHSIGEMERRHVPKGWFMKPGAMLGSPYKEICWIDTDCEVCGDVTEIFDLVEPNKIAMVVDEPWTKRQGEKQHNSGIVAFKGKPPILRDWAEQVMLQPERGDQETLHAMTNPILKMAHITDLPNKFQYLRLQFHDGDEVADKRVVHWTGDKGNEHIRMIMNV